MWWWCWLGAEALGEARIAVAALCRLSMEDVVVLSFDVLADREREASEWEGERRSVGPLYRRAGASW